MEQMEYEFKNTLASNSYSVTKSRLSIFRLMFGKEPLSIKEITLASHGVTDRATVYRNIEIFEKLGIVNRLRIGWKYKLELSDRFHPHHHHISCIVCGHAKKLPADDKLETYFVNEASKLGYKMSEHQLELYGTCQNCQKT